MKHNYKDEYNRVILKPVNKHTSELCRQLRNKPEIRKWFFHSESISVEQQKQWYERYLLNEDDYMYAAFLKKDPELFIGAYAHYGRTPQNSIEGGRLMVDSKLTIDSGLGTDIIICASKIAFELIGVSSVIAEVKAGNERSMRSHINAGFRVIKKEIEKNILMLKKSDFEKKMENNL